MDLGRMSQIANELGPDKLGELIASMNTDNVVPTNDLYDTRKVGYRGIPVQVPKVQRGLYGPTTSKVRA